MKKKTAFAAVLVVTILSLSVFMMNNTAASEKTQERQTAQMMYNDCAGTWYLSYENDLMVLNEEFPDLYAFGNELTIRPDGKIYCRTKDTTALDYNCEMWIPVKKRVNGDGSL